MSIRGTQFEAKFVVSSDLWVDGIILGLDFIEQHDCVIDIVKKVLNFPVSKSTRRVAAHRQGARMPDR